MAATARFALVQQMMTCAQQHQTVRIAYACLQSCAHRTECSPTTSERHGASGSSTSPWHRAYSRSLLHMAHPTATQTVSQALLEAWQSLWPPSSIWSGLVLSTHLTWQPRVKKRKREHGFLKRCVVLRPLGVFARDAQLTSLAICDWLCPSESDTRR